MITLQHRGIDAVTPREMAVWECAAYGMSVKETAHHLGISPSTVKVHRGNLASKFGIDNGLAAKLTRLWIEREKQ